MQTVEIKEISENICLYSERLISLVKYIYITDTMDVLDKSIIINFILEISQNIKIEVENLSYLLK